ncbi:DUF1015 domain-containing protein [Olsenella sp. HMSC062G07]|uniref:DUF1015 domain-containing protein n=1 Tax=Olsenella sp. HMSC062G07 TaxID=1739330 RepID=UPI0008A4D670|nr:DUF1015 domain-containing protein [Olsenella sp. HMSC062G07]OFK24109.1 hypothetical protein HMPREF2826_08245 [Olsenella sp. HMSC062G07]
MRAEPISCLRPAPSKAASFASLPYDVFDRSQARSYVTSHPTSFLRIDRPETNFAPEQDMYAPEVYAKAAELLRARAQDGTLLDDRVPCYYLYRLEQGGRAQTGVVCACAVDEYQDGTIRRHENTTAAKEEDRVKHIRATGAQTGPIFLTYPDNVALDALVKAASCATPLYDFTDGQGVRQTVWRVARPAAVEAFRATFATVPHAYVADGHHRAASAVRVGVERRRARTDDGERASDLFLAVLFPASQLKVLAYNRVVVGLNGHSPRQLMDLMRQAGHVVGTSAPVASVPSEHGRVGMYLDGAWHELELSQADVNPADPVSRLDAQVLQESVLAPLLGIDDPRTSERIRFVGGIEGSGRLEELAGPEGVAFSLYPTSVDELMVVSDAGLLMPPKSTWFEPKLRSGLFIRCI